MLDLENGMVMGAQEAWEELCAPPVPGWTCPHCGAEWYKLEDGGWESDGANSCAWYNEPYSGSKSRCFNCIEETASPEKLRDFLAGEESNVSDFVRYAMGQGARCTLFPTDEVKGYFEWLYQEDSAHFAELARDYIMQERGQFLKGEWLEWLMNRPAEDTQRAKAG